MLIALIMAEGAGWWARLEPYLDYPGFEAWKFLNLGVFVVAMIFWGLRKLGVPESCFATGKKPSSANWPAPSRSATRPWRN